MVINFIKSVFPFKLKRSMKDHLGVPSLHWSLQNLKKKNFNPKVVLDVGAYQGLWTVDLLEVFPDAKVLMVEAQKIKDPYLKRIKESNLNVDYAISLLSSTNGNTVAFTEDETASHVVMAEEDGQIYHHLKTQTLDTLLSNLKFPLPDLLKLDVQGYEMEVLKGSTQSLKHATICLLEVSLFNIGDDGPLLAEMIRFMDANDFQAYDISQFIRRPFDKALYQIDMFFVKKGSYLVADKIW